MRKFYQLVAAGSLHPLLNKNVSWAVIPILAALLMTPQPAFAVTVTVCPSGCDYTSPEAAVNDAARVDGDIVDITTGTYVLGATLQVDNSITVLGNDSVFDANGIRAINVFGDATNFSLTNISITNGQPTPGFGGGAMWVSGGATASVINGNFENNQADFGGAIHNTGSTLFINLANFSGNRANIGNGGAILTNNGGATYLDRTLVDGNTAAVAGGGLAVTGSNSQVNLTRSTVANNAALSPVQTVSNLVAGNSLVNCGVLPGGGIDPGPLGQTFIADASALTAYEITIEMFGTGTDGIPNDIDIPGQVREGGPFGPVIANASAFAPGGVWAAGSTQTLTFNLDKPVALVPGDTYAIEFEVGGEYAIVVSPGNDYPDGGLISCGGSVAASTTSDFVFRTFGGSPGEGSGVHSINSGFAGMFNTTVSGNVGDGVFASDGGIISTLFNTITNNSGNGTTAMPAIPDVASAGLVFITATIVAENGGDDCNGSTTTSGYNLIGDIGGCDLGPTPQPSDLIGDGEAPLDPQLGPLQDNGGRTPTHAIDESSPAFDSAGPDEEGLPCFDAAEDQREVARPNGPACDIGAFELNITGPLQTLIDAALANEVIDIPDGTYTETITIGDGKTLRGSGPANVVLDATNLNDSAITATGDFTLEGVRVTGGNSDDNGGGIVANLSGTDIALVNVEFDNNSALQDGGAVYVADGSLIVSNSEFISNSASDGGAIWTGNDAGINNSIFRLNQAGGNGGAISSFGRLDSTINVYENNSADNGGAISVQGETNPTADSSDDSFIANMATRDGGAIYEAGANLIIFRSTFQANTAGNSEGGFAGDGGAVYSDLNVMINQSIFTSNEAFGGDGVPGQGGAVFNNNGTIQIVDTTIDASFAGQGGGLYNNTNGIVNISGTTFSTNSAGATGTTGGAIGGAGQINISNSTLSGNNTTGNGGGIGLFFGSATLNNVTLAFNAATGLGGPIYADQGALITLSNSLLSSNTGGGTNCSTVQSLGNNLFQNAPCPTAPGDIVEEPLIEFLASNGGLTQTHALDPTSPAIDAASPGETVIELTSAISGSQLSFNGAAGVNSGNLVAVSGEFVAGSIFASTPDLGSFDLDGSFSTQFSFQITDPIAWSGAPSEPSGDGFTFAIASSPTVLGEPGGRLGVATSTEPLGTVSVEFDTFPNAGDISTNAIGVNIGGSGDGQAVLSAAQTAIPGQFDDGNVWTAWIDYRADTNRLDVRVAANGIKPELPQLTHIVDIAAVVGATGYYGFTGGTGLAHATHSVTAWELLLTNCPSLDQRGIDRPQGSGCDIGAFEAVPVPLALGTVVLSNAAVEQDVSDGESYPGVTDIPIIDIPIEKLTGDTFNAPESAPLGSFPIGSFPIGSFDLRASPLGSFPLGSFPIGSFPIGSFPLGSFPLSSLPLLSEGGWAQILNDIPELAGAPLQTVTLEQLLTISPLPANVASVELRDLAIEGSPLASLSLPGLSLGDTTVAELDQWAQNTDPTGAETVCTTLSAEDPGFTSCGDTDTLLGLEVKGAPVSALSLSSLPLGSFPIGSFPIGSFPIGSFPLGSFPIGSFPIGSFPIGSFPIGSFPLGSFPIGSFPLGSFNLLAAPIGSFPLGSFPIGSFPIGSFEIDGKSFCEFYDEQAIAGGDATCAALGINPGTDSLADLVVALQNTSPGSSINSTPLGSFPLGSFPIGSFPIGSFDLATLSTPPLSELTLGGFDGCTIIANNSADTCTSLGLNNESTLPEVATVYGGTLAASPLGSFPIGSFDVASLPLGSFPIGSFEINGAPLGSFPIGSFDVIGSPLGSFPLGSFPIGSFERVIDDPEGLCGSCETLADAAVAGVINSTATLADLKDVPAYATTTLGEVLDAMTLAMLYGPPGTAGDPSTLGDIEDTGNLTLGQLLIAMMLKTDFPWETIALEQLDAQGFSADNFVDFMVDIPLTGTETETLSVVVSLSDEFLYLEGSATLDILEGEDFSSETISDPQTAENEDGTQSLTFNLVLGGFSNNTIRFRTVPPLTLGSYPASAEVVLGADEPVEANDSDGTLTVIPDPINDISDPLLAVSAPADILTLGFISTPDDIDFYQVTPPAAGDRVSVFMSNPAGDNDLIMYEPISTVEAKGQVTESAPLDSVPFEDDGVDYEGNISEEPNALEDVNLASAPLASISTNRGTLDESVSAIAGDDAPFTIQVSGYNGAASDQPYTLRVKVTPKVPNQQCTARSWPGGATTTVLPAGDWLPDTNAVFLVNGARLAASEGNDAAATAAADDAMTAINNLINAPGITNGVVVDVADIYGVDYTAWDNNPCDVDAANSIVNAITAYLEEQRVISPNLAYVTIVGSDEVIPFSRKPDETSIANESTFAGEFSDNALYGALVTRNFLSDDSYGDIDPIPWLDRYLNVPELGVGRLVESAADIQLAAENYLAFGGILDPQTALSAGYDFVADASQDIDETFNSYSPALGFTVEQALIDQPDVDPLTAWNRTDFLNASGLNSPNPVDQVSFNMHFDFDEALPSSGDANGNYSDNLLNTTDLVGADLAGGIWFTVGCHSGTNVPDVSVIAGAPSEDWAQSFSRLGAIYLAQNAYGLGDTEALALTERLMANFADNLNGSLTIGQAHAFAKQQYFADLGLYGEYDYKALQAATLFGLPMYSYGNGAMVTEPPPPALPVAADPISGLSSASWSLTDTAITRTSNTSKGDLFSVGGDVQFVHFRPLQPIVRRDVTSPDGRTASGAFLTNLVTEDLTVADIAFARPVIDLAELEPEIESDEVVFPTAFTNIASFKAPPPGGGPFERRDQLNVIVGQFTSPLDGGSGGTERLFRSFDAQVFYRPASAATQSLLTGDDFIRPEFDNVQASIVGSAGSRQAAFSVDASDEGTVLRVAVLYLQSVTDGNGNWVLIDLVKGAGNTWTGGGPVEEDAIASGQIDYMVQAVDANGNVANSTFKGLFYVAEAIPTAPDPGGDPGNIGVVVTVIEEGQEVPKDPGDWITTQPVDVTITNQNPETSYEYSVDFEPFQPLESTGFQITGDGVHIVTVRETDGSNPVTFVILVDTTPPEVVITTPATGEFVTRGSPPVAEFDCLDAGSGITSCNGTVPDGAAVPETTEGTQSFVVTAQDDAENGPTMAENIYYVVKPLEVEGPVAPTAVTVPVTVMISATDLVEFEETVTIDWGDGTPQEILDLSGASVSSMSADHLYAMNDVYQVTVTVDYEGQFSQTTVTDFVVVYDPTSGFVTGGGWINSPSGAYTPNDPSDEDLTGKANFGFVSKYKKGQSTPDGSTSFRFAAGEFEFEATDYDWMIISGARARYKGQGNVNGGAELYKFQVTAMDADIPDSGISEDGFRIKIWHEGAGGIEDVLYDNGLGTDDDTGNGGTMPLGGGSITVHKAKK